LREAIGALPEFAGKPGKDIGNEYIKILKEIEAIQPQVNQKANIEKLVSEIRKERNSLLSEWRSVHFDRYRKIESVIKNINDEKLKGKLNIKVRQCGIRDSLKNYLLTLDGIGASKVEWIYKPDVFMIDAFTDIIQKGKDALIAVYGKDGMKPGVAEQLCSLNKSQKYELEEIELGDKVDITLNVSHEDKADFKPLDKLSTGQKCTAILHLLMLQSEEPLIIDQPEDNLDNAFIADRVVAELRRNKCGRQFVFATHNANIPVFGDAEWIGILQAARDEAVLSDDHVGSIDKHTVQEAVKQILEGGKVAFETRKLKYGF
jgi:hypothetical protein